MKKITLSLIFGLMALIGYSQIGLVENFDAGLTLPPGWTGSGYAGSVFEPCSVVSLRSNLSDSNMSAELVSPNITGESNGTDLTIAFDYKIVDWSAAVDPTPPGWGEFNVYFSTDDGGAWTAVGSLDDSNHQTSSECSNISFVVPAAELPTGSDVKIKFENVFYSGNYYFYVDNVTASQVVVDPPSCSAIINPANGATGVDINENLSWQAATGIPSGYRLSVGTTAGGSELLDNVDVGQSTTYDLPTLEYSTVYYVRVTPYNDNGDAIGCQETSFTTGADPNAPVDCASGIPINTVYCYSNNDTTTFSFQSSDGAPLVVFFNSGSTENNWDELIITDSDGTNIYTGYGDGGDLSGLMFVSSGDTITVGVTSDGSGISCTNNPWNFDVYCLDTTALPNCNASLTTPINGAVDVSENTVLTWRPATVFVTGYILNMGTTPGGTDVLNGVDVGDVLTYNPGVLDYDQTYYVTIIPYNDNGQASGCIEESFTVKADPNQIVDCDTGQVINTTFCYGNNEIIEYWFASSNGDPISIFFNAGSLEESTFSGNTWDDLLIYDGTDNTGTLLYDSDDGIVGTGNLAGLSVVSNTGNLYIVLDSDGFTSCESSNALDPIDFDVSCVDTTALPNCNASLITPANGAVGVNENEDITWSAASVLVDGYKLSLGTTPGGTDILDAFDVGNVTTYDPGVLPYSATIYVTIVPYNANGDAQGCTEESFTVKDDPNQVVDCDTSQVINTTFCYANNDIIEYWFASSNGDPISIFFNAGVLEESNFSGNTWDDLYIYDGTDNTGTLLYDSNDGIVGNNNLAGFSFVANSGNLYIFFDADGSGSCETGGYTPVDFDVTCVDTTALPNCNASLISPANGAVDINENDDITWSAASVLVTGYKLTLGTTPGGSDILNGVDVGNVTTYDPGTLPFSETIYVTIVPYNDNGDATGCTEESFTIRNDPNVIVDCSAGPVNTTYCYTPNDTMEFNFASSTGNPLVLEFNAGQVENNWDELIVLDSDGSELYNGYGNNGNLAGLTFTSTGPSLTVMITSDGSGSCSTNGYTPWDFDVWCLTCLPQTATFNVVNGDCDTDPDNPVFEVEVNITDMGDAASLELTDNQGSAVQTVTEAGIVIMGPYPASTNVVVTVANADDPNCIIESNPLSFICPPPPNPCSIVFAGEDATVDCNTPEVVLESNFHLYGQDTENYEINAIDTCPTPPVDGATPTSVNVDDTWSEVIDLGFDFCFYGGVYDQVIVGSNGVVSFEVEHAGGYNSWALSSVSTLPNATNNAISQGNIFGVGHDIDPSVCGSIDYVVLGSAPYRQFVVNYNEVCYFGSSCTGLTTTSQIILHESSNNIDIHILEKPTCAAWNDGLAVVGIQSVDDTQAASPPGRNTGVWSVAPDSPESYRFSPSGTPNYTLEWTDEEGTVISTEESVTVSPSETTTYSFAVTYELCTGGTATVSDDVVVTYENLSTFDASFEMTANCDGATATILGDAGGTFSFNPEPADGATIDAATGEITNAVPGAMYNVDYTVGEDSCPAVTTETVTVLTTDDFQVTFDFMPTCEGATVTITGDAGGTFSSPDSGITVNAQTGEVTGGESDTTYTIEYTTSGECPVVITESFTTEYCELPEIPQGISPNGDGRNDTFDLTEFNVSRLEIFNRHGVKVYSRTNYTNQWYGQSDNGDELPVGTYFYVMEYDGNKTKTSWVYLNREN
ncbi:gliding motility-associated-like protein [Oceanihabitans sediminis]|uniref:T9SS type B sorting domain-containing protein n=1 Tax=Oceanihabitans sediminis TaxID=1812012 RepID=UPI000E070CFD|nr:gliding motility-associated C-terminal domain-containing protein [Oceanihabitans sediminis]RBP34906.1 gliding motility-associated-like protein [Oceanihabitans sediminis]